MNNAQPGILSSVPAVARYLSFSLTGDRDPGPTLSKLTEMVDGDRTVVGLGLSLVLRVSGGVDGLRPFPVQVARGIEVPSTPHALWCWLRGAADPGELIHRSRELIGLLEPAFALEQAIDAFKYGPSLDLTGYEDGTENPQGGEAEKVAIVAGKGPGMDGSSFVAVQQWQHDLDCFASFSPERQDDTIGRRRSDNEELETAPESAHVKRTAQEQFDPEAFVLRRSMPWTDGIRAGLVFVAFGRSFDAFETLLGHMVGADDGVTDALFSFTRPLSGSYFWCPPQTGGRLDLRAIGL